MTCLNPNGYGISICLAAPCATRQPTRTLREARGTLTRNRPGVHLHITDHAHMAERGGEDCPAHALHTALPCETARRLAGSPWPPAYRPDEMGSARTGSAKCCAIHWLAETDSPFYRLMQFYVHELNKAHDCSSRWSCH